MSRPKRAPGDVVMMHVDDLAPFVNLDGPVMLADRTGVYVHSFKCLACRLEFQLFSWLDDRHTASNVTCPECGKAGGLKLHWIATLNESSDFGFGGAREIFQLNPRPGSILVEEEPDAGPPAWESQRLP